MQNQSELNLARKWRSKNFDQIIGQDLCVRILKNGLYLNSFFPVYLFSGQRGCGKTSTARIFAAAVNCLELENFQKDAKNFSVPCLKCVSCESMQKGKHPDFIEIDAASHTGVDNVRNIIEASTLLPLMGRKKIYLIDEAHMLSKAAFNAFLKIMEEPPSSVLFILATTDVQKIIETVRSRSFQLFFTSISSDSLIGHLENICKQESIQYDIEGLKIIVRESEGSARDAINLLEQIRFSNSIINKSSVLSALGHLSDEQLLTLFDLLINKKNIKDFLTFLEEINFYIFSPEFIWNRLLELMRASIRVKHGIDAKKFIENDKFNSIVSNSSLNFIIFVMSEFCKNEIVFNKSINKSLFLELLCLKIINLQENGHKNSNNFFSDAIRPSVSKTLGDKEMTNQSLNEVGYKDASSRSPKATAHVNLSNEDLGQKEKIELNEENNIWNIFIEEIKKNKDALLESVFSQAKYLDFNNESGQILISLSKKLILFQDMINDTTKVWQPILKMVFQNQNANLIIKFEENNEPIVEKRVHLNSEREIKNSYENNKLDFSDKEKWKLTNTLLKYFPGTITEVQEETNEQA